MYKPSIHLDGTMPSSLQEKEGGTEEDLSGPAHWRSEIAFFMHSFFLHWFSAEESETYGI